jgi:hypothetical protein
LENLLKIGQLKEHPADAKEIARLLAAAERGVADARAGTISPETRLDAAYRSIAQIGLAALMAQGYRPDTNRPGHHMTIIQTLTLTLGIDGRRVAVLDTLRRRRNLSDYTGADIDEASVAACIEAAEKLLRDAKARLGTGKSSI